MIIAPRKILLVEDTPSDIELTLRVLNKCRIANEVIVVHDGVEALEYLRETRELPALVLMDLRLPRVGGLEVLKKIRTEERFGLLPVVIFTSYHEEQDIVKSYKFGANSFMTKPVDFTQFEEAVKTLGMYWLLLNNPVAGSS